MQVGFWSQAETHSTLTCSLKDAHPLSSLSPSHITRGWQDKG